MNDRQYMGVLHDEGLVEFFYIYFYCPSILHDLDVIIKMLR